MNKLYLDLDGVLVDLNSKFYDYYDDKLSTESWAEYERRKDFYIFTKIYDTTDVFDFWSTLSPFEGYMDFVDKCISMYGVDNISILSAATKEKKAECASGKYVWCKRYLPMIKNLLFTEHPSHKKMYSRPNYLLIDDSQNNIIQWVGAGGFGILHTDYDSSLRQLDIIRGVNNE